MAQSTTPRDQSPPLSNPQEAGLPQRPAIVRIWRIASSTWLGVGLLTALSIAYGILSIIDNFYSGPKSTLPSVGSVYGHWSVVVLTFAFCLNLLFATVRIPISWDRAGAWCSHLGLMFLVVGSVAFWRMRTEGQCLFLRATDGGWSRVNRFFLSKDVMTCYVSASARILPDSSAKTEFASPASMDPVDINVPVKGAPPGVSIKASRLYPRTELTDHWYDDEVGLVPAVEVQISHGEQTALITMCESSPETCAIRLPECVVSFETREAMSQERIDEINARTPPRSQPSLESFSIHYRGRGQPVLVVRDSSGRLHRRSFTPGQIVSTASGEHPSSVRLIRTMNRARRGFKLKVPPETQRDPKQGAIELTITSGSQELKRIVPYYPYLAGGATTIRLPSGRRFYVAFSNSNEELPEPISITRHEFKTAPGSSMVEDYICDLEIGSGVRVRKETVKLNAPVSLGRYRLTQSTWRPKNPDRPDYSDPGAIILGVADRPGILLIFVGGIAVCLGFPYAFYIKPLILKRKSRRAVS
ncbi:MAG: hypothetical protein QGG42_02935 [Phycisphaerae bacterium]|jgi:hypothetical protein|nr:hypothetical protein [Phycisphaerae bacterium]